MDKGHFYYLDDRYFLDFHDPNLMKNKETVLGQPHDRPCFYTFEENSSGIYWMIPFSSQTAKYKDIYNRKIARNHKCDTIMFGEVLGVEKAFLIQNMCPATSKYIRNEYLNRQKPVMVNGAFAKELERKARKVLYLQRRGVPLIFPDVLSIERQLQRQLSPYTMNT